MDISGKDLASLIKACSQHGVSSLKLDNLEIQFGAPIAPQPRYISQRDASPLEIRQEQEELKRAQEEARLYDLQVTDPAEFERKLMLGETAA